MTPTTAGAPLDDDRSGAGLRTNTEFRLLWTARSVSSIGDSLGLVALMLFVVGTAGQAFAVAALLLVGEFAPSLLGPVSGAISDRFDRRRVMVVCELVQAASVLLIALTLPPLPVMLILVGLRSVAAQVLQAAARAAVPVLVPDRHLESANSSLGFGANGAEAVGPFAAAALLPLIGIRGVLVLDVATFLVSAALLTRLRAVPALAVRGSRPGLLAEAVAGLRFMAKAPLVRAVALGFVAVVACTGVDDVALVFLTQDSLHAGDSAVALLYGAVGLGLLAGYLLLAKQAARSSLIVLFLAGCAVSCLGNLLTGLAWAVAAAFAFQFLRGLGISAIDISVSTLLQRQVPPAMTGRVFGSLYGAIGAAAAASYVLGAVLLELTDPRVTFIIAGSLGLLFSAITALTLTRIARVPGGPTKPPPA